MTRFTNHRDELRRLTDMELLTEVRRDNHSALTELYDRFWEQVFLYVVRVLRHEDEAADVVQETFIALWQKRNDLPQILSLKSYLIGIARYKALRSINLNLSQERYRLSILQFFNEHERSPETDMMAAEMERFIDAHIDRLPERMREVFLLSRRDQLSYSQIAEQLNISDKTVKKQIHNALKYLRGALDDQHMWATVMLYAVAVN